jgi:hypothetical protein
VTAEPNSESGLGRRANLYALRVNKDSISKPTAKVAAPKAARKPRAVKTSTSQTPTADALDKIHAALAAPEPASVTVPAVTIAPEATPAPAPEVTPTPAPEAAPVAAVEAAPAPVAEPVATLANS